MVHALVLTFVHGHKITLSNRQTTRQKNETATHLCLWEITNKFISYGMQTLLVPEEFRTAPQGT